MKRHFTMALIASGAAIGAAAGAAMAAEIRDPDSVQIRTVTVPYDAAEVRNEEGAEKLFFRIRQAAEEACDIAPFAVGYERWDEHACETEAVSEAVQDVGEPELTQYYSELGGSAMPEDR
jgi:UrcA family protein